MHVPSTTPLIARPYFHLLIAKDYYRLFEFLTDTLAHMQPEVLNIGIFKIFKQRLKILKPGVLKATSFRR